MGHATIKAQAWYPNSETGFHILFFLRRSGCNNCGNQVCCLGALAPGSSTAYPAYSDHTTDKYTPWQTHTPAYMVYFPIKMCSLATYKLSCCTCLYQGRSLYLGHATIKAQAW